MVIRKPAAEVYEAFVNPEITTQFWFTKSSGRLEAGKRVRWDWEMYGVGDEFLVTAMEENRRLVIESSDRTEVEWVFTPRTENETMVTITHSGFTGDGDAVVNQALDSMGGYTMVLCGLKALLEHNIRLNLVADKAPDAHVTH
ncbi:SRPBCC family protein [Paenibacillus sp. S-38]|uniref:SRPBCC family protein n=1 Tax=Paenibacillus sp. S-38 TaxID=3416710 RepID=UPI003CF6CFDB